MPCADHPEGEFVAVAQGLHEFTTAPQVRLLHVQPRPQLGLPGLGRQIDQHCDPGQRQVQGPQPCNEAGAGHLVPLVVAVPGHRIGARRDE